MTLDVGPASPLRVAALRGGTAKADEGAAPRFAAGDADAPHRDGPWLVAPIPLRRRGSRGVIAVRRPDDAAFGDDDVEILTLLAQMASSALDAAELDRAIASSEERWRVLVETAPIGIIETDLDGSLRWWNRAAGALFGWGLGTAGGAPTLPEPGREPAARGVGRRQRRCGRRRPRPRRARRDASGPRRRRGAPRLVGGRRPDRC